MSDKAGVFFESYNMAVESGYNKIFDNSTTEEILKGETEGKQKFIEEEIEKWENQRIGELDDSTPKEYISGMSIGQTFELFEVGSKACDQDLPDIFIDKLASFQNTSTQKLLDYVITSGSAEEDIPTMIMAVRVLGLWKSNDAVEPLIKALVERSNKNELLAEEIVKALINIGSPSIGFILNIIEGTKDDEYVFEQFIGTLVNIGKPNKTDEIFKCLKQAFQMMPNKMLMAMYLGDYGDGRAIPLLRGYIDKNAGKTDKETFMQIKDAIRRLGGKIDDLKF